MNKQNKTTSKIIKPNINIPNFDLYFYGVWLLISAVILCVNIILGAIMMGLTIILIIGELVLKDKKIESKKIKKIK